MHIPVVNAFVEWWVKCQMQDSVYQVGASKQFDGSLVIGRPFSFLGETMFDAIFVPDKAKPFDFNDDEFDDNPSYINTSPEYPALIVYNEDAWHTTWPLTGYFELCVDSGHVGKAYWVHNTIRVFQNSWRRRREGKAFRRTVSDLKISLPEEIVNVIIRTLGG